MAVTTWDGSSSTDWNTAANWDTNAVPTSSDDVIIPDTSSINNCELSATGGNPKNVHSLKLEANGTLIGNDIAIRVYGEGDGSSGTTNGYAVDLDGIVSGLLHLTIQTDDTTNLDIIPSSGNVHDLVINLGDAARIAKIQTGGPTLTGNLTITSGQLSTENNALTVTGAIDVASGGALTCNSSAVQCNGLRTTGGTVNLPDASGSFTVKGTEFSGYGIYDRAGSGNIVHNSGTVTWDTGGTSTMYALSTFNNITTTTSGTKLRWFSALTLAGNLTVAANTDVYEHASAGGAFTVGGNVIVSGTLGDSSAYSAYSFGSISIESGGTYNATSATTTITVGDFSHNTSGTFTHRNGEVVIASATSKS